MTTTATYRDIRDIGAEEVLEVLVAAKAKGPDTALKQAEIFVLLGGDPNDHRYAYMSYLTKELRADGHDIHTSRRWGLWLP